MIYRRFITKIIKFAGRQFKNTVQYYLCPPSPTSNVTAKTQKWPNRALCDRSVTFSPFVRRARERTTKTVGESLSGRGYMSFEVK